MGIQTFLIEFKYPIEPSGQWMSFSARVRESPLAGMWEIYSISSDGHTKPPYEKLLLKKDLNNWIDVDSNEETLFAALVGRAIDNVVNKGK